MGERSAQTAFERLYEVHPDGEHKGALSGRVYEHLLNVYCHRVHCAFGDVEDLDTEYQQECQRFLKKNFTYFRRGTHHIVYPPINARKGEPLQTNMAQMRFLNWIAIKKVDKFILDNMESIMQSRSMQTRAKTVAKRVAKNARRTDETGDLAGLLNQLTIAGPPPIPPPPTPAAVATPAKKLRRSERTSVVKQREAKRAVASVKLKKPENKKDLRVAKWHHPPPGKVSFEKRFGLF